MKIEELFCEVGRFWGRYFLSHGVSYLRRRVRRVELRVVGDAHLTEMGTGPWLMVSNHIMPHDTPLGPFRNWRFVQQYNYPADAFIIQRAVSERTEYALNTVARCDRGWWSPNPVKLWVQQRLGNPFARGQMEGLKGFIPVEKNPGCYQRHFLKAIQDAVRRREPILIFPLLIDLGESGAKPEMGAGACRIAAKYDLPILPVCIIGADSWKLDRPVTIVFGEPFATTGLSGDQIAEEIRRRILTLHAGHVPQQPDCAEASLDHDRRSAPIETRNDPSAAAPVDSVFRSL